jgi:uncharacterized protein (TIGR00269 family)
MKCTRCKQPAEVALPSHHAGFCRECFLGYFTRQVQRAVKEHRMFGLDDRILCALSGGKDSLAALSCLADLGYNVSGLYVDLAIPGSSEGAGKRVESFCREAGIDCRVVSMREEGLPIPEVKEATARAVCSICGKIKRYHFNKAALEGGFDVIVTGHNLDDETARLFSNTLRWDVEQLAVQRPMLPARNGLAAKARPLYRLSEFETAAYCFFKGIEYWMKPCPYSKGASFTFKKSLLSVLERQSPGSKISFYDEFLKRAAPIFAEHAGQEEREPIPCPECGSPSSGEPCALCRLKRDLRG